MGKSILITAIAVAFLFIPKTSSADQVRWLDQLDQALAEASSQGKPVLIHFYSSNCPPCKLLDVRAFNDAELIEALHSQLIPVKINVDFHRELADRYQVTRWPTDVYLFPDGTELYRTVSPQDPKVYSQMVHRAGLRSRDWVLEKNSTLMAAQRRQSQRTQLTQSAPEQKMAQTPRMDLAPGQRPPPPTKARLTAYPSPNDRRVSDDSATVSSFQDAKKNRYSDRVSKDASPIASRSMGLSSGDSPIDANSNAAPIVPGNRYKSYSKHFADSSKPSSQTTVENVHIAPPAEGYAAASMPNAVAASLSVPGNGSPNPSLTNVSSMVERPAPDRFSFEVPDQPIPRPEVAVSPTAESPSAASPIAESPIAARPFADVQIAVPPVAAPQYSAPQFSAPPHLAPQMVSPPATALQLVEPKVEAPPAASFELAEPKIGQKRSAEPSIVFDGKCPVALEKTFEWRQGSPKFGVKHRGRIYYCESAENRAIFLSDPDRFSPVLSGYDVVQFIQSGQLVEGDRRFGCTFQDRIYLFASKETYEQFLAAKEAITNQLESVQSGAEQIANQRQSASSIIR